MDGGGKRQLWALELLQLPKMVDRIKKEGKGFFSEAVARQLDFRGEAAAGTIHQRGCRRKFGKVCLARNIWDVTFFDLILINSERICSLFDMCTMILK